MKKATFGIILHLGIIHLVLACFIVSCGPATSNTIKIGVAGAHTGDLASYGIPAVKAAQLAINAVNEKGGILGKKVELVIEDDGCMPEKAANIAARLVGDKVVAVIGHTCIGATKSALGIYNSGQVVVISPSAASPDLTAGGTYPNFFRTIVSDDLQARLDVDFAVNSLKLRKFAVLHDKGDYGKEFAEFAKGFLEKTDNVKVVCFEGITPGQADYSAVIERIEKEKADALIYGGYHPEASKLIMQMNKKKMKIQFIANDRVKDDAFLKMAGSYAEGAYVSWPQDADSNPLSAKAIEEYRKLYNTEPEEYFLNAYAAILAILNAIEKAGSTKYDEIVNSLKSNYVQTPLGNISFDERGDIIGVGFSIFQVQNGKFQVIK